MTSLPNGESKEPVIRLFVPPGCWYEDRDGNRFVPTADESVVSDEFDVMHTYDMQLEHTAYKVEDGDTSVIGAVHTNWDDRLVLAMATSTPYDDPWRNVSADEKPIAWPVRGRPFTLRESILIAGTACERCVAALMWYYGVTERNDGATFRAGYPAGGAEWTDAKTRCHFCATDKELDAIADATLPGERFFVDTPRRAPELFADTPAPIAETRSPHDDYDEISRLDVRDP